MNQMRPLNPFNNVVAAGIANCDLNSLLGYTLEGIHLSLGGGAFTKAMITLLQLKANGKVIWESDGSKCDALELFKGYTTADATKLSINFMELRARTPNAFQSGALCLAPDCGIVNLRLEVTIAGATTPTLSGVATISPGLPVKGEEGIRKLMVRRHRNQQTIGAAGLQALQVPHFEPSGGGSVFKRVAVFSALCTGLKIQREGITEYEVTKAENEWIQKQNNRVPQANLVVLDAILDNMQNERVLDTRPATGVRSAQFYGIFSGGETITIETEELLTLGDY